MTGQHDRWVRTLPTAARAALTALVFGLVIPGATSMLSGCSQGRIPEADKTKIDGGATSSGPRSQNTSASVRVYSADNLKVTPPGAALAFAPEDPKHMTIALHPGAGGGGEARRLKDPGDGAAAKVVETRDVFGTKWFHVRIGDQRGWVAEHLVRAVAE